MDKIYEDVMNILSELLSEMSGENFNPNMPIVESGINSLQYINMIVEIENLYDIELPDDFLAEFALKSFIEMCDYIREMVSGKNE